MIAYNAANLKKIEQIFKALGYQLRIGKGSFQSGYCLLENKKVVVLNGFHAAEARINSLIDILQQLSPDPSLIANDDDRKLCQRLIASTNTHTTQNKL